MRLPVRQLFALCALAAPLPAGSASAAVAQFYYMDDAAGMASLYANYRHMGVVSPVWYSVTAQKGLQISADRHLVAWASRRVKLMPVVVNEEFQEAVAHQVLSSPSAREALAAALLKSASAFNLYGYQLDFENIPLADRDSYSRFVERVCQGLARDHRVCSVAVPAPLTPDSPLDSAHPKWRDNERSKAFDYAALAHAASFLTVMAYDEYSMPGQPGPVAGHPWVEACIRKMLDSVAASKLVLGVPFYYRLWNDGKISVGPFAEAARYARECHSVLDPVQQEWTATCQSGGAPGTVWYHNGNSLKRRLELVKQYGLGGFSAWRLGQEPGDIWESVFRSLGGRG